MIRGESFGCLRSEFRDGYRLKAESSMRIEDGENRRFEGEKMGLRPMEN
jgi:hypothetical protein